MTQFGHGFIGGGLDQYTKMLLHFDGANGSAVYTDVANPSRVFTQRGGGALLTTAAQQFGTASLNCGAQVGWIDTPDVDADFNFATADFTIDCWFNAGGSGVTRSLFGQVDSGNNVSTFSVSGAILTSNVLRFSVVIGGSTTFSADAAVPGAGWHHFAGVRSGNTIRCAYDGAFGSAVAITAGGSVTNSASRFAIGNIGEFTSVPLSWNGQIDEFRVSNGIARWTANFTPPTAPYS